MIFNRYFIFGLAALSLLAAPGPSAWSESIDIVGTGDGMAIMESLAAVFNTIHPEHTVTIADSIGSSGGIKAVGNDRSRLGRVARQLKDKEKPYGLVYLPIAKFPVVFFVNSSVDVNHLSRQQILEIYSGKIINWKDAGGSNSRIRVVIREKGDSSMMNLRDTFPGFFELVFTVHSKIATTTQNNLDTVLMKPGAIGFGPYSDAIEAGLKVLTIENKHPLEQGYPSFGVLALIFKEVNRKGVIASFIDFIATVKGVNAIKSSHALPITDHNQKGTAP